MPRIRLGLDEVRDLATRALRLAGCDELNAAAVADTITTAERDLCHSHGLFRLPGYMAALKSGKANGVARPAASSIAPAVVKVDGDMGFAPLALQIGREPLAKAARENGIAALAIRRTHHFAALWVETSALAEMGLCAFAFTSYMPCVAPAGGTRPFFGTNPMSFAWPRKDQPPMVFDQASSMMARGEIQIAAREGRQVPLGAGIDRQGNPTTDPNEILQGAQLAFGGHKGASIALMIDLLAGPLIGEVTSYEAGEQDNGDGGPCTGGEFMMALDPARFGDPDTILDHAEALFTRLLQQDGTRLPGERRYRARVETQEDGIEIPQELYDEIVRQM